jgi:predicted O-methyltransferase YrrM
MAEIDDHLMSSVDSWIENLYGKSDPALDACLASEHEAGMRIINVSPNQGKLIHLIARMCGAKRILEIGTLAGYSTIWLARALPADGRLVSLEFVPLHAEVARKNIERAGLSSKVEIRVGPAADTLRTMAGEPPFDLTFIDANKTGYPEYLELVLKLSHLGTVILADNVIREGEVMAPSPDDADTNAVAVFNRLIAEHPRLDSTILPMYREKLDGMSISVVK